MTYQRTATLRADRIDDGVIQGTLATNGEASDGHILDVRGLEQPSGTVPLLFGHDAHSGRNNLGSWTDFRVMGQKRGKGELGDSSLMGTAQIELGGSGEQAAFRQDVAHMIAEGHINAFSVRWDPVGDPVRRQDLPKDHYAYRESGGGLFFEHSRILEGSVVTIGADPSALVARALESEGRGEWMRVLASEMVAELTNRLDDLQGRMAVLEAVPISTGGVAPEAVTEDSAPSTPARKKPEPRPAMSVEGFLGALEKALDLSDRRIEAQYGALVERLRG